MPSCGINVDHLCFSSFLAQQLGGSFANAGSGNYHFLLTALDGDLDNTTPPTPDGFRIKITDPATGNVIYDNLKGSDNSMTSKNTETLGGGSIVISTGK